MVYVSLKKLPDRNPYYGEFVGMGENISVIQATGITVTIISVYLLNRRYDHEH